MRTVLLSLALTLSFPAHALAAFNTPHEALGATRNTGMPREFEAAAHNSSGDIFLSTWVNGAQEGTGERLKLKMNVTTHMKQKNDLVKMRMRVLVYQNMLYYTINDVELHAEDELTKTRLNSMLKKWIAMPLPASIDIGSAWNYVDILDALNVDILQLAEVWNDVRTSTGDMRLEHTKYQGGNAYSVYSQMTNWNLHIKMNTNNDDILNFGKYYLSRGNFVLQGQMQPHGAPVYLDVPKQTITSTEFEMNMLGFEFPMMYGNVPLPISEPPQQYYQEPTALLKPKEPEIPEGRNYVEYAKRSGLSQEQFASCAWPGTLDAVELERKGLCPKEKLDKRKIRVLTSSSPTGMELREQRIAEDRIVDNYNTVTEKFEMAAHKRDMHRVKTMLSRASLTDIGSDGINAWIEKEVIPYYVPMMRSSIVEYIFVEDDMGNEGIAIHKMVVSESGRRKDVVLLLFQQDKYSEPVIVDVFLNTKLRQLRMDGVIE